MGILGRLFLKIIARVLVNAISISFAAVRMATIHETANTKAALQAMLVQILTVALKLVLCRWYLSQECRNAGGDIPQPMYIYIYTYTPLLLFVFLFSCAAWGVVFVCVCVLVLLSRDQVC